MIHAKFQDHRTSGSGEEFFFLRFLPYTGMAAVDAEEKTFENCERTDGRRRTTTDAGPWVSYKLTYEPLAQVS